MGAIGKHSTATSSADWTAADHETKLPSPLTRAHAESFYGWYDEQAQDPNGDGMPDFKNAYKFGHHNVTDAGYGSAANTNACANGIAVLNGARGGTDIPASDRQGVYDHLAAHLEAAGIKPAPLGHDPDETEAWAAALAVAETIEPRKAGASEEETPIAFPLGHDAWAIRQDVLPRLIEAHRAATPALRAEAAKQPAKAVTKRLNSSKRTSGAVAVITLTGVITPRGSFLSMLFGGGGGGLVAFREAFREAVVSPDVGAIVLDIDSPGGLISLVPETAAEVFAARGTKPIIAVCNTMACSAAYWIAAQADEVVCSPSGQAGSIGVYIVHEDWSKYNADLGVVPTYIKAGKYKAEGNPDEPLSDDAVKAWQGEIDDLYAMFVDGVAQGRGVSASAVRAGFGEGRSLLADRAVEAGLADRVDPIEDVIAELFNGPDADDASARLRGSKPAPRAQDEDPDDEDEDEEEPDEPDEDEEDDEDEDDLPDDQPVAPDAREMLDVILG